MALSQSSALDIEVEAGKNRKYPSVIFVQAVVVLGDALDVGNAKSNRIRWC